MGTLAQALEPRKKSNLCVIARALEDLDDDDAATLQAWLADPSLQHSQIARALSSQGYVTKGIAVGRHRHGECGCDAR